MKKLLSLILALVMIMAFSACSEETEEPIVPTEPEEPATSSEPEAPVEPEVPAEPATVVYFVGENQEGEAVADLLSHD